jgi:CubicO group peptidase (beta-lactamase class C family)
VTEDALDEVELIFERFAARGSAPGVAYGVVIDDRLVAGRGLGTLQVATDVEPDLESVFRIASMTKSFTAAAILLLRDEGRLRLDDPVARWISDVTGSITIEHLLTMSGGWPTDDPWGDRQQGLDLDRFGHLVHGGFRSAWTPGSRF